MRRLIIIGLLIFLLVSLILVSIFIGIFSALTSSSDYSLPSTTGDYILNLPSGSLVYNYLNQMEKELDAQELPAYYLPILLAIMQQESGGNAAATGGDIMQASESIDGNLGNITSADASIKQGVSYFKSLIDKAQDLEIADLRAVLQAYNYGGGFLDYVKRNGGSYTKTMAIDFREMMFTEHNWIGYGDPNYVENVERYLNYLPQAKDGQLLFPVLGRPYCSFGFGRRIHPLYGTIDIHSGMDFLGEEGTPIYASLDGVVSLTVNPEMGICIKTDLDEVSIYYMHLSHTDLRSGDTVRTGDLIGLMGNTGVSTTSHLHFRLDFNDIPIDPAPYFNENDYIKGY